MNSAKPPFYLRTSKNIGEFRSFFLSQNYQKVAALGNHFGEIEKMIDWERFRPITSDIYRDDPIDGGRPHTDEILMITLIIRQNHMAKKTDYTNRVDEP